MSLYVLAGNKQEAGEISLCSALQEVIDELIEVSLAADIEDTVKEILERNGVSYE